MTFDDDIDDKINDLHAMLDASMREEGEAELEESQLMGQNQDLNYYENLFDTKRKNKPNMDTEQA